MLPLTVDSPLYRQPPGVVPLKPHQRAVIRALRDYERGRPQGPPIQYAGYEGQTPLAPTASYGLHCDAPAVGLLMSKTGSGKTLMALGLIASGPLCHGEHWVRHPGGVHLLRFEDPPSPTLVAVPHPLFEQWRETIDHQTELRALYLNETRDLWPFYPTPDPAPTTIAAWKRLGLRPDPERRAALLAEVDVVLFNIERATLFYPVTAGWRWSRVIYDEIHQLRLTRNWATQVEGRMHWGLSADPWVSGSTPGSLSALGHSMYSLRGQEVTVEHGYVEQSLRTVGARYFYARAAVSRATEVLRGLVPEQVLNLLAAGNLEAAFREAAPMAETGDNILGAMIRRQEVEREALLRQAEALEECGLTGAALRRQQQEIQTQVQSLDTQIASITSRLQEYDSTCLICADEMVMPTAMLCCQSVYCFACVQGCLAAQGRCPLCRAAAGPDSYRVIDEHAAEAPAVPTTTSPAWDTLTKDDLLYQILRCLRRYRTQPRILLFSDYQETLVRLEEVIREAGMRGRRLAGNPASLRKTLRQWQAGELEIILLDSKSLGSGLNLQSAKHVILAHRLASGLEDQVIGRAQRYGRRDQLTVIYLLYPHEPLPSTLDMVKEVTRDTRRLLRRPIAAQD